MIKLNLDKEQVETLLKRNPLGVHKVKVMQDWLSMYAEIERLNKALKEMVKDIEKEDKKPGFPWHIIHVILFKHFPELEEK